MVATSSSFPTAAGKKSEMGVVMKIVPTARATMFRCVCVCVCASCLDDDDNDDDDDDDDVHVI